MTYNFDDEQQVEIAKNDPFFETKRDEWVRFIRHGWKLKYPDEDMTIDLHFDDLVDFHKIRFTARVRKP
ncbi:MAG: hypothetical protein JWO15_3672 [Sphingomonadales bacterium]|nr:hypothetical protein [Sphingomonadales bacterium]